MSTQTTTWHGLISRPNIKKIDGRRGRRQVDRVRLHKLATIHARSVVRRLGVISPPTHVKVEQTLRALLAL
jgi:hypothetical protein